MQRNIAIVAMIAIVVAGFYYVTNRETPSTELATPPMNEVARTETEMPVATEETPEIGTPDETAAEALATMPYTVSVSYLTPSRTAHDMDVTLVIAEDGTVTDASIVYDKGEGFSNNHQERFDGAYKSEVIGKPLDTINLATVAGASLTTQGFNEAVAKVIAQRAS